MRPILTFAGANLRRVADLPISPLSGAAIPGAPDEPELDVGDIQGNGLGGFNKDFQLFLFLRVLDVSGARRWLKAIVPRVSTLAEVIAFNRLFRSLRARQGKDPIGLTATWLNIGFSARGIGILASSPEAQQLQDPSFQGGLFTASGGLGDPNNQSAWKFGGSEETDAHIMLMLASDDPEHLKAASDRIDVEIQQSDFGTGKPALRCIWRQSGATLPGTLRGHEHFGFKDGISQPAARGRVSSAPFDYLTPRWLDPLDPDALQYAEPGRPLIWPGQFVLGWQRQSVDDGVEPGTIDPSVPAWAKNGSYVVFRRLQQRVDEFHAFLRDAAATVAKDPNFGDMTDEKLGAMLVGRWATGAPIMRTPDKDNPALAQDDLANNHFRYAVDTDPNKIIPMPGYPGDGFPQARADFDGLNCPLAAHIRKVNPRDQDTDQRSPLDTLAKLIMRRGIPYGGTTDADRGLCFVSYQSSIISQFEFLSKVWANDAARPRPAAGLDLIIGQQGGIDRSRSAILRAVGGDRSGLPLKALKDFVVPTGGGYFFSPGLRTLGDWALRG